MKNLTASLRRPAQILLKAPLVIHRWPMGFIVDHERRLVERELRDVETACRRQKAKSRSGRQAQHERRSASLPYESIDVFDLSLFPIGRGIGALTPAATVIGEYGEVVCKERRQFRGGPERSAA
jgi:hypothetical protein